ncbi:MAG: hypothetical protein WAU47_07215, partial [Desulfobaccales bacterium]
RPVIPVLTKADKIKQGERGKRLREITAELSSFQIAAQDFIWFSASSGEGREILWQRLLKYLGQRQGS